MIEGLEGRRLLSAKIGISGNGAGIGFGDTTPVRADFTDFGPVALSGTASVVTRDYVVKNTGTSTVTFSGHRQVLSGEDASQFTISKGLPKTLAKGKTATITVSFDPSTADTQRADLTVSSNASAGNYKFSIKGSGISTSAVGSAGLQVAVTKKGSGSSAAKGQVLEMNYTGFLLNGKVFDSSLNAGRTPFDFTSEIGNVIKGWQQGLAGTKAGESRVLFIPSALGYGATGSGTSIPANADLIFEVTTLRVGSPSLKITSNSKTIASGDTSPTTSDNTNLGSVKKGKTVTKTYTLTADLFESNVSGITFTDTKNPIHISGTNASDFTVSALTSATGGYTFTITFKPSAVGNRKATLSLGYTSTSTDPGTSAVVTTTNNNYTFALQGTGT